MAVPKSPDPLPSRPTPSVGRVAERLRREPSEPAPGSWRAWLLASRPATLTAAAAPVLVGTAISYQAGPLRALPVAATFGGAFLLQIASNFANDVFDFEKGTDTEDRLGPARAVQSGLVSPRAMKNGLVLTLLLAVAIGVYLAQIAGWPIVLIGLLSIMSAVAYTGGPYPLGYHGFGDVFVMLFFGFVAVCGTTYVHHLTVPPMAWAASAGVGAVITNILVVNNVRDREGDALAGKRTLAVRWGKRGAFLEYCALLGLSYLVPVAFFARGAAGPAVLLALVTLPWALKNARDLWVLEGRPLNAVLVSTAKLVFVYGLGLATGIFLGPVPFP